MNTAERKAAKAVTVVLMPSAALLAPRKRLAEAANTVVAELLLESTSITKAPDVTMV